MAKMVNILKVRKVTEMQKQTLKDSKPAAAALGFKCQKITVLVTKNRDICSQNRFGNKNKCMVASYIGS